MIATILFILIGQQINAGVGYWILVTVYALFRIASGLIQIGKDYYDNH